MSEHYEIVHDIETLDTRHSAVVATLGAVCVRVLPDLEYEVVDTFYARIEYLSQVHQGLHPHQAGRTTDPGTRAWWDEQHPAALAEIKATTQRITLEAVVATYSYWITQWPEAGLWAKGSDFDNAILADCFAAHGQVWPFRRNRCLRTLLDTPELLNVGPAPLPEPESGHIHHHALHDAMHESRELIALRHHLQGLTRR